MAARRDKARRDASEKATHFSPPKGIPFPHVRRRPNKRAHQRAGSIDSRMRLRLYWMRVRQ